jgi:predicted small lipoprotein YifL
VGVDVDHVVLQQPVGGGFDAREQFARQPVVLGVGEGAHRIQAMQRPFHSSVAATTVALLLAVSSAACGQKGPLERPAAPGATPASAPAR